MALMKQLEEGDFWATGFHFGDWLALDNTDPRIPYGWNS